MEKINKKAFTLVELIVVITILAILGTIAFISLQGYSKDARDSKRMSDIGNMKTSLELFALQTGQFPSPDSYSTITYSGGIENVWFQGVVGDIVTSNLRSLNDKPLDPLTNDPYTYSVTNSYKEYELLALYEGGVAYNSIISKANAAVTSLTPKIDGNYNGVFVKTPHYIIPVPSIITAELLTPGIGTLLTQANIKSLVMTNGQNIPKSNLAPAQTGLLDINLSVYTGSITKDSGKIAMMESVKQIQNAYSGTTLSTNENIAYILNQTTNDQIIALGNSTVLKGQKPLLVTPTLPMNIVLTSTGFTHTNTNLVGSNVQLSSYNTYQNITYSFPQIGSLYLWSTTAYNIFCGSNSSTYVSRTQSSYFVGKYNIYPSGQSALVASSLICRSNIPTINYSTSGNIIQTTSIILDSDYNTLTLSYNEILNSQTLIPKLIINGVEKSLVNKVYTGLISAGSTIKVKFIFIGIISQTPQLDNNIAITLN